MSKWNSIIFRMEEATIKKKHIMLLILLEICILSMLISLSVGRISYSFSEVVHALLERDSPAGLIIRNVRLPRMLCGGLIGLLLSLSGCILQGVMRNHMASPSVIGVTGGARFVGLLLLVAFPKYQQMLSLGTILGALISTSLICVLAYRRSITPTYIILSGMAVSAMFGAGSDAVRSLFSERLGNVGGFMVGSLNGVTWEQLRLLLPFAAAGFIACMLIPSRMNILMLGDELASTLGLRVQAFRIFLVLLSSMLAGASVAVVGMISFVGLIVPHIARLLVGSDYTYLFPATTMLGFALVVSCDTVGRIILSRGELSVSIILAIIGAPFFLFMLYKRERIA